MSTGEIMLGRRYEVARLQSDFYRDSYHKILRALFVAVIIMLLLIGGIVYLILFQPAQHYYATTTEGKIIPLDAHS